MPTLTGWYRTSGMLDTLTGICNIVTMVMYRSNRSFNIPPAQTPGHLTFLKIIVQISPLPGGCWSFDLTDTLAITKHWSIFITPQLFVDVTIWLSQSVSSYIGVLICWFNNSQTQWFLIQFSLVTYLQHLDCIIVTTRNKVTNKRKKKKKKLMALIEVYGGQRSLAFELHHRDIMNRNT